MDHVSRAAHWCCHSRPCTLRFLGCEGLEAPWYVPLRITRGCNVDVPSEDSIDEYGKDHEFTKLLINHKGIDPDDAFSTVPYEKGFHMVWYLDRLVGRENFDKFIPHYFEKFAGKSLDSYQFKDTFLEFFSTSEYADLKEKLAEIDWEGRFYKPGLPPKPDFDTSLIDVCYELVEKWKAKASPRLETRPDSC